MNTQIVTVETIATFNAIDVRVVVTSGEYAQSNYGTDFVVELFAERDAEQFNYDELPCDTPEEANDVVERLKARPTEFLLDFTEGASRDWLF